MTRPTTAIAPKPRHWTLEELRAIAAERGTWHKNLLNDWRSEAINEFLDWLSEHEVTP